MIAPHHQKRRAWYGSIDDEQGVLASAAAQPIRALRRGLLGRVGRELAVGRPAAGAEQRNKTDLLVRSFVALLQVERGYRTDNVLAVTVQAWQYHPSPALRAAFVQQTVERLALLPGVRAAGVTSSLPLTEGIGAEVASFEIEGQPAPPSGEERTAHATSATAGYFHALGIPLRRGRLFEPTDDADAPPVVVINEAMARRYWPGGDPLRKRLTVRFAGPPAEREVVGVVADVRHAGLDDEPRPGLFVPHAQAPTGALTFVVRTDVDPLGLLPAVREQIWAMNRALPIASVGTLEGLLANSLRERRFNLLLLLGFSLVALSLAAVGVYGLLSHETRRRTGEIGLRLALGAQRSKVLGLVVGDGLRLVVVGIVLGALLSLVLTRLLAAFLFGVTPSDPGTFAGIAALLITVSLLASYLPARRAARVDPMIALRAE